MTYRRFWWALAALAALASVYVGTAFYRAARASHRASAGASPSLAFTARSLDRSLPAIEPLRASAQFTDAALFDGRIFISTPSELLAYDSSGELRSRWRSGLELPSATLGALAVATLAGASAPELFLATDRAGLVAFDGRSFRQILPADSDARQVTALLALPTGRLLFGTSARGVLSFDGKHLLPFQPSLAHLNVIALAGGVSSLWVGTADHGLFHWNAGSLQHFAETDGLPDARVNSLAADGDRAFAATPMGIAEFRDGRFERHLAAGVFSTALFLHGDRLLAGSLEEGLSSIPLDPRVPRLQRVSGGISTGSILRILDTGESLLALAPDGLYAADSTALSWHRVIAPESGLLADRNISAVAADASGRLWVGYFDRGLDVVDGAHVSHFETDVIFCVNRILPRPDSVAVATANGVAFFDSRPAIRQILRKSEGLAADAVSDIVAVPDGLAFATASGITFVDASGTHSVSDFHGLVNQHVYTLASSGDRVLAGTLGGLSVIERGVVHASYTTFNSRLRHNWITAIQRSGDTWFVGTYGASVMRFTANGTWDAFANLPGDLVINPNAMLATESRVYAGTLDRGLWIYELSAGRWTAHTDGLPSLNVTALARAGGVLYIGTGNGLVRVPEQNL